MVHEGFTCWGQACRTSSALFCRGKGESVLAGGFPLGPFIVDDGGKLSFRTVEHGAGFSFSWRGRRFSALLKQGSVDLTGVVGRVPSSAGGAARREVAFAAARALPRLLPSGWALTLMPDHRLQIQAEERMAWPAYAADLIVPIVHFLLRIAPYLDLMDEAELGLGG